MNTNAHSRNLRGSCIREIYTHDSVTKTELSALLHVSIPTITSHVNELARAGMVNLSELNESTGGRRAARIVAVSDYRIALGISIMPDHIYINAVDLRGDSIASQKIMIDFRNDSAYCSEICNHILQFCLLHSYTSEQILGVSFAIMGLVDDSGEQVVHGSIIDSYGFSAQELREHLPFPCHLHHDIETSAYEVVSNSANLQDAYYLFLDNYVGGALILGHEVRRSGLTPHGLIEHMTLHPGGRPCYCGKKGCVHAYCSIPAILNDLPQFSSSEEFFQALRSDDAAAADRWHTYLQDLATIIYNLMLVHPIPIILGGEIACNLTGQDLETLAEMSIQDSNVVTERPQITCHTRAGSMSRGAALLLIHQYLNHLFEGDIA